MTHKAADRRRRVTRSVFTGLERFTMPITRGYQTILNEMDEKLERLGDDWERVRFKRRMGKREAFKRAMKQRADLILKVIQKLKRCRGILVRVHEVYGNSPERQRVKGEMESRLIDLDKLIVYFNKF